MTKHIQHKGGSTAQNDSYTGLEREITVNTTKNTLRVHDGTTVGGTELARMIDLVPANGTLPPGGNAGEYLVKNSAADFDLVYTDRAHASVLKGYAKNVGSTTLPKGTPVYASGGVSGFSVHVEAADAADVNKMPAIGVLGEALAPEAEGELLILGEIMGVDTSAFNEGDLVYVAAGGGYTNVEPTASDIQKQFLGIVTKTHATSGGGMITGTGVPDHYRVSPTTSKYEVWDGAFWQPIATTSELAELSDVSLTDPAVGDGLFFNGATWINYGYEGGPTGGGASKRIWSNNIDASAGTTVITPTTTPPLITNGTQLWTLTLTPLSNSSTYVIQTSVSAAASNNKANLILALFRGSTYLGATVQVASSPNNSATLTINITDKPNTTSPVTYQVRVGVSTGTWYVNRRTGEVTYGGLNNGWVIWEY